MKVLLVGSSGQLGQSMIASSPAGVMLMALDRQGCDLTDAEACSAVVQVHRPDVLINAAAYTQVDRAESEQSLAFAINARAPEAFANALRSSGGRLIQISTDFVFDGQQRHPYATDAAARPLNVYGASKLAGEQAVRGELGGGALVVRTSWVYSSHGNNFVRTMLRLMSGRESVSVVADQVGSPTWARSLAKAVWEAAMNSAVQGILHWTDSGQISWHGFAVAIQEEALARGLLKQAVPIHPISGDEYARRVPGTTARPAYSVLETESTQRLLAMASGSWRVNLGKMLDELAA